MPDRRAHTNVRISSLGRLPQILCAFRDTAMCRASVCRRVRVNQRLHIARPLVRRSFRREWRTGSQQDIGAPRIAMMIPVVIIVSSFRLSGVAQRVSPRADERSLFHVETCDARTTPELVTLTRASERALALDQIGESPSDIGAHSREGRGPLANRSAVRKSPTCRKNARKLFFLTKKLNVVQLHAKKKLNVV